MPIMTNIKNTTARTCYKALKRLGAMVMAVALVLAVGCSRQEYTDTENTTTGTITRAKPKNDVIKKNSDVLNMGFHGVDTERNPLKVKELPLVNLLNLAYDSLFVMGNDGRVENALVETYSDAGDGNFDFVLRSGVTFHDGSKLTASDVVRTIGQVKEAGNEQEARNTIYNSAKSVIESATAKDERTVTMRFKDGGVSPLHVLTFPILSAGGVGTGLYKIDGYTDTEINLSYYEQSWKQAPRIKTIKVTRYPSEEAMSQAYKTNTVDVVFADHRNVGLYKYTKNTRMTNTRSNEFYYLLPNLATGKLTDVQMRRAFSFGLDKENIVSRSFDSNAIIADFPIPSDYFVFDNQLMSYSLDVGRCIRKFGELGYTQQREDVYTYLMKGTEKLTIRLIGLKENDLYHKIIAQTITSQMADIGLTVETTLLDKKEYEAAMKSRNYDLAIANTTVPTDLDLRYMLSTGGSGNFNATSVADMDTALNNIGQLRLDMVKVKDEYVKIQEILVKQIPMIGLCFVTDTLVYSDRVSGIDRANSNLNMLSSIHQWNFEGTGETQSELLVD